jgi:hypothetical protein
VDSPGYHKFLEDLYEWKYAPYARNYNALGEVNNQMQIIGNELLDLWKAPPVATIKPDSSNVFPPEIVTFSPTQTSVVYLFFVNKDMKHQEMGFTIKIRRSDIPPPLQSAYILDLSERHLLNRTVDSTYITFYVTLGAGEGKLVRLMAGTEPADACVTDPDIGFQTGDGPSTTPRYVFTEGDRIMLSATIYNLGFSGLGTLVVKFYDGHRDTLNLIDADTVSLPPLTVVSAAPADTVATCLWVASRELIGPHNITVFAEEPISPGVNTKNNLANMALLVLPEDYASAVVGDPWDMTESGTGSSSTPDIDSFQYFAETPDSISGVWEAKTMPDTVTGEPRIYLNLADSISGSKYGHCSVRLIQDPETSGQGYLKIGWKNQTGASNADSVLYEFGRWQVKELDLSDHPGWKNNRITSFWIRPALLPDCMVKLSWVKLTTK